MTTTSTPADTAAQMRNTAWMRFQRDELPALRAKWEEEAAAEYRAKYPARHNDSLERVIVDVLAAHALCERFPMLPVPGDELTWKHLDAALDTLPAEDAEDILTAARTAVGATAIYPGLGVARALLPRS